MIQKKSSDVFSEIITRLKDINYIYNEERIIERFHPDCSIFLDLNFELFNVL